jgi:hypothetical protein
VSKPDWRQSYQATIIDEREALVALRERCVVGNVYRPIFVGSETYSAASLTNDQIERICIRRAEQSVQRAMTMHEANMAHMKRRRGEAF